MNTFEIFLIIVFMIVTAIYIYAHKNMHYDEKSLKRTYSAGYKEKQVTLSDGTLLNYAEGPDYDGNPSLLLIHGQSMQWEDYSRVLPELAKYYHVYAIDCHGHGSPVTIHQNIPEFQWAMILYGLLKMLSANPA